MANSTSPTDPTSPVGEENFQLVWHNYQSNFHEVVGDVLTSEAFADVSLVAEGRLVRAHRLVLSACSPYLHNVLRALPPAPAAHPVVLLPPEVSLATLHALLAFMYRGVVHVPHAALVAVLHAGDILQVRGLCRGDELQRPNIDPDGDAQQGSSPIASPHQEHLDNDGVGAIRRRRRRSGGHGIDKPSNGTCSPEVPNDHALHSAFDASDAAAVLGLVRVKEEPYDWSIEQMPDEHQTSVLDEAIFRPAVLLATKNETNGESQTNNSSRTTCSDDDEEPTPLTCEQCHEVFPRAAAWVRHLQIHPPVARPLAPPPPPPLLPPRTTQVPRVSRQIYSSDGPVRRPHTCSHCGKRFSSRASLSIHGRTHTGETPYTCDLCRKGFNVKSNLLRHLRTLHNRIVSPSDVDAP